MKPSNRRQQPPVGANVPGGVADAQLSFVDLLRTSLTELQGRNPGFSLRAFARRLHVTPARALSENPLASCQMRAQEPKLRTLLVKPLGLWAR